ncbi:MAG: SurA N-terminal domain-containing protein [Pseudomonadota bacterium]
MLSKIRGGLNSFFVLLILGLLIAAFVIWGIGDPFGGAGGRAVVQVGKAKISVPTFERVWQREIRARQQEDVNFSNGQALREGLDERILRGLVDARVLSNWLENQGVTVSNDQVRREIASIPAFQFNGTFSEVLLDQLLNQQGASRAQLVEDVRGDLTRRQLFDAINAPISVPEKLLKAQMKFYTEERVATIVRVPASKFSDTPAPSDEDLQAYYEAEADRFLTPERRRFRFIPLTSDAISPTIEISEEDLETRYALDKDKYNIPELRDVSQIVLGSESEARRVFDQIEAGESFAEVADKVAGLSADETALGQQTKGDLEASFGEDVANAVFKKGEPGLVEPASSDLGWHIFLVNAIEPGEERTLTDVRDQLLSDLRAERVETRIADLRATVEDELVTGASLEDISAALGIDIIEVAALDEQGRDVNGTRNTQSQIPEGALPLVFARDVLGEVEIELIGDDGYFVFAVSEILDPVVRPLDEVRSILVEQLTSVRRKDKAEQLANEILEKARAGEDFISLAVSDNLVYDTNFRLERHQLGGVDVAGRSFAEKMFELAPGELSIVPAASGDGVIVMRLNEINEGSLSENEQLARFVRGRIEEQLPRDVSGQFLQHIRNNADIQINQALLAEVRKRLDDGR